MKFCNCKVTVYYRYWFTQKVQNVLSIAWSHLPTLNDFPSPEVHGINTLFLLSWSRLWCRKTIKRLINKDNFYHLPLYFYLLYLCFWGKRDEVKNITSTCLTSKDQNLCFCVIGRPLLSSNFILMDTLFCFCNLHMNSKYFALIHFQRKGQTNVFIFSFKGNINISFYTTSLAASLNF